MFPLFAIFKTCRLRQLPNSPSGCTGPAWACIFKLFFLQRLSIIQQCRCLHATSHILCELRHILIFKKLALHWLSVVCLRQPQIVTLRHYGIGIVEPFGERASRKARYKVGRGVMRGDFFLKAFAKFACGSWISHADESVTKQWTALTCFWKATLSARTVAKGSRTQTAGSTIINIICGTYTKGPIRRNFIYLLSTVTRYSLTVTC